MGEFASNHTGDDQEHFLASSEAATSGQKKRLGVLKQFRVLFGSVKRHYQWIEKECGISGAQLWALAEIAHTPGIKVSALAQQLGIHLSTASNMLRRLEGLSLAKRIRTGKDHRVVQVVLTPKGDEILRRAPRPLVGILQQALADLPQRQVDSLYADLGEVIRLMKFKDANAQATPLSEM